MFSRNENNASGASNASRFVRVSPLDQGGSSLKDEFLNSFEMSESVMEAQGGVQAGGKENVLEEVYCTQGGIQAGGKENTCTLEKVCYTQEGIQADGKENMLEEVYYVQGGIQADNNHSVHGGLLCPLSSQVNTFISHDNNGLRAVVTRDDQGFCCKCSGCSAYDLVRWVCPAIKRPSCITSLIVRDTDDDHELENGWIMRDVEKRRSEMSASTREISAEYDRLLNQEIMPFIRRALETSQLSLGTLKRWMINARRNLRKIVDHETQSEKVLQTLMEMFPRWYDTDLLNDFIDWLGEYLTENLIGKKRSIQSFISMVDRFISKRVFDQWEGENEQQYAIMCIDPEWNNYPAMDFHQIYCRAEKALMRILGCGFTIYFCTVLKECIIRAKKGDGLSKSEQGIAREAVYSGWGFPTVEKEKFIDNTSVLVAGISKRLVLAEHESGVDASVIGGCELFSEKQPLLLDYIKPFKNDFEQ